MNTRVKSSFGLLLLFVAGLILFLFTRNRNSQPTQTATGTLPKPQRNNNPFALVQTFPDNWQGYTGGKPFLSFDNPAHGVRAGFINLYNRYLSKGLNTIDLIAPVYTGIANWNDYAQGLSKISGLNIETKITLDNWAKLGRAIEQMENGYRWVSDSDFNEGLKMALNRIGK